MYSIVVVNAYLIEAQGTSASLDQLEREKAQCLSVGKLVPKEQNIYKLISSIKSQLSYDFQIAIMYGDLMILHPFTLLTFVGKKGLIPSFLKKKQLFGRLHYFFFCILFSSLKEMQFLFIHIIFFIHPGLSARRLSAGYSSGYLMLSNLTNQFIKLSNGNLWRSSV